MTPIDDGHATPERRANEALRGAAALVVLVRGPELRVVAASGELESAVGVAVVGRPLADVAGAFAGAIAGAAAAPAAAMIERVPGPGGAARAPADHAVLCVPVQVAGAPAVLVAAAPGADDPRVRGALAAAVAESAPAVDTNDLGGAVARAARALLGATAAFTAWKDPGGALTLAGSDGLQALELAGDAPRRIVRLPNGAGLPRDVVWTAEPIWLEQRVGNVSAAYPVHPSRPGSGPPAQWALVPLAGAAGVLGLALPESAPDAQPRALLAELGKHVSRALRSLGSTAPVLRAAEPPPRPSPPPPDAPPPEREPAAVAVPRPRAAAPEPPPPPPPRQEAAAGAPGERLLAMIGHDLRTPLAAIDNATALLLHGGRWGEAEAALLRRIARNSHRIALLADTLVDLARVRETGEIPIERRASDLRDIVERAVRDVQDAFPGRAVAVVVAGPCPGEWDATRLEQVVTNLAQNAIQHSPSAAAITVTVICEDPARVRIDVNNAQGTIPAELLPRVFEPFEAGPRSRGAGLGLFIVREIVRAHGGRVTVRSSEREGTTFSVELPRISAAAPSR